MRIVRFTHPLRQALGLMFQRPHPETLYVFDFGRRVQHSFHMWFVFHPIDLFLLDSRGHVLERHLGFKPFSVFQPAIAYHYALECAPGVLKARVGERVPLADSILANRKQ